MKILFFSLSCAKNSTGFKFSFRLASHRTDRTDRTHTDRTHTDRTHDGRAISTVCPLARNGTAAPFSGNSIK